jgi:proteasome accessory factor B
VITRRGNWYVVGFDRSREASRAFRISRIRGEIHLLPGPVIRPRPLGFDPRGFVTVDLIDPVEAVITVNQGGGAEIIRRAASVTDSGDHRVATVMLEHEDLIGLLTASLPQIHSVRPETLLEEVRDRVVKVMAAHRGDGHD